MTGPQSLIDWNQSLLRVALKKKSTLNKFSYERYRIPSTFTQLSRRILASDSFKLSPCSTTSRGMLRKLGDVDSKEPLLVMTKLRLVIPYATGSDHL